MVASVPPAVRAEYGLCVIQTWCICASILGRLTAVLKQHLRPYECELLHSVNTCWVTGVKALQKRTLKDLHCHISIW